MKHSPHHIEIFSAGCPLCKRLTDIVELGKCAGCKMTVYHMNSPSEKTKEKSKKYGITSVPTAIIDTKIKVVGIPEFQWLCGDEFYEKLLREFPLKS